jgi:hypothetical protein
MEANLMLRLVREKRRAAFALHRVLRRPAAAPLRKAIAAQRSLNQSWQATTTHAAVCAATGGRRGTFEREDASGQRRQCAAPPKNVTRINKKSDLEGSPFSQA